jgi:PEP-CTERM motif-containing protein
MKTSRILALLALVLVCSLAFADGIKDPKIIIRGAQGGGASPLGGGGCPQCRNVGTDFSFSVPAKGEGTKLFFTNTSGKNWTSLTLIEKGVPAADVSCAQSLFISCTITTLENGATEIVLSGVAGKGMSNPRNGIPDGSSFLIGFGCVKGNCWPHGLEFTAHAGTAVPEPGTIALMMTGLGAIVSRRKKWLSRITG